MSDRGRRASRRGALGPAAAAPAPSEGGRRLRTRLRSGIDADGEDVAASTDGSSDGEYKGDTSSDGFSVGSDDISEPEPASDSEPEPEHTPEASTPDASPTLAGWRRIAVGSSDAVGEVTHIDPSDMHRRSLAVALIRSLYGAQDQTTRNRQRMQGMHSHAFDRDGRVRTVQVVVKTQDGDRMLLTGLVAVLFAHIYHNGGSMSRRDIHTSLASITPLRSSVSVLELTSAINREIDARSIPSAEDAPGHVSVVTSCPIGGGADTPAACFWSHSCNLHERGCCVGVSVGFGADRRRRGR